MTTICTGLSSASLNGIIDLGNNIMLLCNECVDKNERDKFIRCRTMANMTEKIENLDFSNQLKNMEKRLTELVDKKIETAIKTTCEKVDKKYAAVSSKIICHMLVGGGGGSDPPLQDFLPPKN